MSATPEEFQQAASIQLQRVRSVADDCGFDPIRLPPTYNAVHLGIEFGPTDYVLLSIEVGADQLFISAGGLYDINDDRLAGLEVCNARTRSMPAFPCFYAEPAGAVGADVIVQRSQPVQLVVDVPPYFQHVIRQMPRVTTMLREACSSRDLGGTVFGSSQGDIARLMARAM